MSEAILGNPWHGKMTPSGLVLADNTLKTAMAGTNASGGQTTYPYLYVGDDAVGHTYYHKTPGLPEPITPFSLASIGGEFKNDIVLSGLTRRYSPFVYGSGIAQNEWLHYGADGRWRRMSMTVVTFGPKTYTVEIRRRGIYGSIGGSDTDENVLIATLVLTHTAIVNWVVPQFPALDCSVDGRSIVLMRTDVWGGTFSSLKSESRWDEYQHNVVAAWRIDIDGAATTATDTLVWQVELATEVPFVNPATSYTSSGPIFWTGAPTNWEYFEPYHGEFWGSEFSEHFTTERLVGVAFAPDGTLHLIRWTYDHNAENSHWFVDGTVYRGHGSTIDPVPPASAFPTSTAPTPSDLYPYTESHTRVNDYTIHVVSNATILHTLLSTDPGPIWSEIMTNNVFNLRNSSQSIGRFGPGAADVGNVTPPVYASFNPRENAVHSSPTPIGFI